MTIDLERNNPRHRAFARLVIACRDWRAADAALRHITANVASSHDPLYYPLTTAAVVCYARPFLGGRSHARIPSAFERFPDEMKRANHAYLISHRSLVVAHANEEKHQVTLMQKGSEIEWGDGKGKATLAAHGELVRAPEIAHQTIPFFLHLVEFQLERMKTEIERQKDELFP